MIDLDLLGYMIKGWVTGTILGMAICFVIVSIDTGPTFY